MTLRLNAGDETRIMADTPDGICLPLCDIKCGGMTGRTLAEGERIAADLVARYNALATIPDPEAFMKAARGMREALADLTLFHDSGGHEGDAGTVIDNAALALAAFDATLGEQ